MNVRKLSERDEIIAGDGTRLRELLHGPKDGLPLRYSLAWAQLPPGGASVPHRLQTSEVYYVLEGFAEMTIDGETSRIEAGDAVEIPPNATQHARNTGEGPFTFLCIVDPAWRAEDEEVCG
jgi:mannose-6-phosphate isomerase-like protein (cupin superfamily)